MRRTRFRGEVAHKVFIGVTEKVIAHGPVLPEIQGRALENADQVGQPIPHLLAPAELVRVVKVRDVDHAFEVVRPRGTAVYLAP